jgi:hypothetical protein
MNLESILESIPEVKVEDLEKIQLQDIQKMHPLLDLDNPLTYIVYLDRRPDLSEEEKILVWQIIMRLNGNAHVICESAAKVMDVAGEPEYLPIE